MLRAETCGLGRGKDQILKGSPGDSRRSAYTIGYKPTNPKATGGFCQIRVEVETKGHKKMVVRTENGYSAGATPANSGGK